MTNIIDITYKLEQRRCPIEYTPAEFTPRDELYSREMLYSCEDRAKELAFKQALAKSAEAWADIIIEFSHIHDAVLRDLMHAHQRAMMAFYREMTGQ